MKLPVFQIDAFADSLFKGNPAAVVPLQHWLSDELMQKIAGENNLSETAFFVPEEEGYQIRWFTPKAEVNLCGHATLATAHVIFNELGFSSEKIQFFSKSGKLEVKQLSDQLQLDFPADLVHEVETDADLTAALGNRPEKTYKGKTDFLLLYQSEELIRKIQPDFQKLIHTGARGIIVTARGKASDFVSRFFAPSVGVNEDPVTGSAHTTLIPFWAAQLGKKELTALQLSERGGKLWCTLLGDRVLIAGKAVTYLRGEIDVWL
jgi:PhzF family phenazine biosynthesis protein